MSAILTQSPNTADDRAPDLCSRPSAMLGRVCDFLSSLSSNLEFGHPLKKAACCPPKTVTLIVEYEHGEVAEMRVPPAVADCDDKLLLHIAGQRQIRHELPAGRIAGIKR